ncbi:hypothetical protein BN1723_000773 [Verticillium longisporum]|uniref:Rhodopsin domain-containing protein n=1 Tax=Verticillium longisporum TaxID=100787 RepID=A0A0G4N7C2_VERLO|nr:hypothetical protein BN1723_000773 [Verticillium longisporum]
MGDPLVDQAFRDGRVPEGITKDFLNESRDGSAIAAIAFIFAASSIIVIIRLLSRGFMVKLLGFDDALAALSLLLYAPFVGLCIKLIQIGSGRHYEYIQHVMTMPVVEQSEVLDFVAHLIYTTSLLVCRISGLAFYHRLCNQHNRFMIAIRVTAGVLVAGYLPQMCLIIFHCLPVTALWPYDWQPGVEKYSCLAWGIVYSVNSVISLFCDFLLFGIPIAMLRMLRMQRKQKIQLACILLPGILVIAISSARLALVIQGQWEPDMSWAYNPMLIVEVAEIGATLIALSIPGIKPVFDRFILRKDISGSTDRAYYQNESGNSGGGSRGQRDTKLRSLRNTHTGLDSQENINGPVSSVERMHKDDISLSSGDGIVVRTEFELAVRQDVDGREKGARVRESAL